MVGVTGPNVAGGRVILVGAGPGDPKLLTLRALEVLREAEVVAYDELISPEVLALAPPEAERLAVGRRAGDGPVPRRIHPAVLERARLGRLVVRLKAGDPFIFGRGGEEGEALAEAGIPFEVVPGVSAALGAAAACFVPLTHRLHASSVTFLTGHEGLGEGRPRGETLVFYMGSRRLAENLEALVARGWEPSTPAAYIAAATTPAQTITVGTLADLAARTAHRDPSAPALIVVGGVVGLRARVLGLGPLAHRRILVGRARPGPSEIAARLAALGAEVFEAPEVEVARLRERSRLLIALGRLDRYGALAFACAPAVDAVLELHALRGRSIVAVGVESQKALARRGIEPIARVEGACRSALTALGPLLAGRPLLLFTSEGQRPHLVEELVRLGIETEALPSYRSVYSRPECPPSAVDLVVLPSSSAAELALSGTWGPALADVPMVAMGPRTEAAALQLGARRVSLAAEDTIEALVQRALELLEGPRGSVFEPAPAAREEVA